MNEEDQKEFEEFQKWKRSTVFKGMAETKQRMDSTDPITIPRGYLVAGGIAMAALVVATFPILLLGVALGAFLYHKIITSIDGQGPRNER